MSMIWKALVLCGLALACVFVGEKGPDGQERMVAAVATERLFEIELPAGDVPGFSIDAKSSHGVKFYSGSAGLERVVNASLGGLTQAQADAARPVIRESLRGVAAAGSFWLDDPANTGVVFRGAGKGKTHIRPGSADATIVFDRHPGTVRLEGMTVHCGSRQGIFAGLAHPGVKPDPKFSLETQDVDVIADGVRTTWPVFTYGCRVEMRDGKIDGRNGLEHDYYGHGLTGNGATFVRMTFLAAAQAVKVRSDTTETMWAGPAVTVSVTGCTFDGWYEPHSSRGGGGIVLEGASANLYVQGSLFRNKGPNGAIPAAQRTRAIMVDDGSGDFWGVLDGKKGSGFAAGHILIRGNAFEVGPGTENLSIVIRVGNLSGGSHRIARSVRILDNGIYGEQLQLQLSNLAPGRLTIAGNNTEAIAARARSLGIDTRVEARIPLADRTIPVSEGLRR